MTGIWIDTMQPHFHRISHKQINLENEKKKKMRMSWVWRCTEKFVQHNQQRVTNMLVHSNSSIGCFNASICIRGLMAFGCVWEAVCLGGKSHWKAVFWCCWSHSYLSESGPTHPLFFLYKPRLSWTQWFLFAGEISFTVRISLCQLLLHSNHLCCNSTPPLTQPNNSPVLFNLC